MKPEVWITNTHLNKVRNKLINWSTADVVNFAYYLFNKVDLTKAELLELIKVLKESNVTKAPVQEFLSKENVPSEITWKTNKLQLSNSSKWVLSGEYAKLRFNSYSEVAKHALSIIKADQHRQDWSSLYKAYRADNHLKFIANSNKLKGEVDSSLVKLIERRFEIYKIQLKPLPDNNTVIRRYWSLKPGDIIYSRGKEYKVTRVKANIDKSPTINLEIHEPMQSLSTSV